MSQQYTLVARPVILSENKRNVIPHGRPLSPIGTVRSARPFFVPRQVKDSFAEEKHGDTIYLDSSHTVTSSTTVVDYQKSVNENLMTINNNLSLMLKESFAGIDSICQKVRVCLLEANTIKPPENLQALINENLENHSNREMRSSQEMTTRTNPYLEETRLVENVDSRTIAYQRENYLQLSTCEEESDAADISNASIDEVPDLTEDLVANVAEVMEENDEEGDIKNEDEQEKLTNRSPSITPFFTILNSKTKSIESVGVNIIKSMTSKIGISRKNTAESFHKTMKEVEKLTDYEEFLTRMVEGINKEIDECYAAFPKIEDAFIQENDNKGSKDSKKNDGKKGSKPSSKSSSSKGRKCKEEFSMSEALKRFSEVHKFQKELMEDQFSENDLSSLRGPSRRLGLSIYTGRLDFTYPDVYRKRAITDLHKRLEAQVEANDSLIFFQKLMARSRKHLKNSRPATVASDNSGDKPAGSSLKSPMRYLMSPPQRRQEGKKQRSLSDLSKKYQDSLWFKQKKCEAKRGKKEPVLMKKRTEKRVKADKKVLPQSYTIESSASGSIKHNKPCVKAPSQASVCNCKIKITNDQPLSDAQRCKLHWMRAKYTQLKNKKLQYLDILDDITKNDLLPIKAEYPRRDEIKSCGVKNSYLYKLMYGKTKETQNAWDQLFQPSIICGQENCQKCSSTTNVDKKDASGKHNEQNNTKNVEKEPISDLEKGDIIRKLSKYIFAEGARPKNSKHVFTVMPVHVFYDNSRIPLENRRTELPTKLPLVPMKETKEFVKKAEWNDAMKRTKHRVVYDPILRKIEREIRSVNTRAEPKTGQSRFHQTNSWSPKHFSQYCSPTRLSTDSRTFNIKIDTVDRASMKQRSSVPSKSAPPIAEIFKRSPKPSKEKVSHLLVQPLWNYATSDLYRSQKDTEVRDKIQKTVNTEVTARLKGEQQRKIWEHKYGKSIGQRLVNFIEKQPAPYQIPVPRHALPKTVSNPVKHQIMLEQLRTLKQKNDNIQTNIQKAIQVIENKMVDILSKPTTSGSIEAFDEMEKEITNVLSLMKTSSLPKGVAKKEISGKIDQYGADVSDELFQRLDRILESPGMSSSGKSSGQNLTNEKAKRKNKLKNRLPPKSTDMNQICFSSTSASGEEKFTITGISPKRTPKITTLAPLFKNTTDLESTVKEDVSAISSDLRKLENELKFKENAEYASQVNEEEDMDSEPIREPAPFQNSTLAKQRNTISGQEQVVNLALFRPDPQEGSAGDQLKILQEILENQLKSVDGSDEKTHSIGVSFSQGDYEVQNVNEGEVGQTTSEEKVSDDSEMDTDSTIGDSDEVFSAEKGKGEAETNVTEDQKKAETAEQAKPQKIYVTYQEAIVVQQKMSQLSVTDPYFTPLTSPLIKTRYQIEEDQKQFGPIAEEEKLCPGNEENETLNPSSQIGVDQNEKDKEQQNTEDSSKKGLSSEDTEKPTTSTNEEEDKTRATEKDDFYEHVNKIISRVENVYNQLEEFEEEMLQEEQKLQSTSLLIGKIPVFHEKPPKNPEVETDTFLAPSVHAVKEAPESPKLSPRMTRSPSLFNVLNFLDNLADFKQQERAVEVYTPRFKTVPAQLKIGIGLINVSIERIYYSSYVVHNAHEFCQATIHQTSWTHPAPPPPAQEEPKKKVGCLKNPGSHSTVNTVSSKSKQKVSFLLQKEEKSTQVSSCPFHSVARILSKQKMSNSTDTTSLLMDVDVQKDEQVSAYLDARENKSVDKMSLDDDEITYQSTFDFSDENSSDKSSQMPEQIVQNLQETLEKKEENATDTKKKSVVEIFRSNNAEENLYTGEKRKAEVKVFSGENDHIQSVAVGVEREEAKGFTEEDIAEPLEIAADETTNKSSIKVFYDDYKSGQEKIDLKLICGFYNEDSLLQVQNSLGKDLAVKKRDSLEKLLKNLNENTLTAALLKESNLFKPLNNLNKFIDSKLLKEAVEKRQSIRMMRQKSATLTNKRETNTSTQREVRLVHEGEKENLLKGFYVFVYLLMFTALNLEYKCIQ